MGKKERETEKKKKRGGGGQWTILEAQCHFLSWYSSDPQALSEKFLIMKYPTIPNDMAKKIKTVSINNFTKTKNTIKIPSDLLLFPYVFIFLYFSRLQISRLLLTPRCGEEVTNHRILLLWEQMVGFSGDETAPFFGFLGAAAALVFSCKLPFFC